MVETNDPVVHFYRALVDHTDMARQRLDTTTNWAVVTTVGVISFSFSSEETPHFVLLMLLVVNSFFLLMEARRYQLYDVWQRHLDVLHRYFVAPAMTEHRDIDEEQARERIHQLGLDLGRTVPQMSVIDALGFRIRRHYIYVFMVTLGAWLLKLYISPYEPVMAGDFVGRASVGLLQGHAVMLLVGLFAAAATLLAFRAPSEYLVGWTEQPSPLKRLLEYRWFYDPTVAEPIAPHLAEGRSEEPSPSSSNGT